MEFTMRNLINKLLITTLTLASLVGCVVGNQVGHSGKDVYATFGNIDVFDGERAGNLENNSGNITVGKKAKVKAVEIINGNISFGELSEAYSLETVNGNILVANNAYITRDVKTINGNIDIKHNVNIGANVIASNGNITLAENIVIQGDILFEKSLLSDHTDDLPTLNIAEGVTINGKIHLYRDVKIESIEVENKNKIISHYKTTQ